MVVGFVGVEKNAEMVIISVYVYSILTFIVLKFTGLRQRHTSETETWKDWIQETKMHKFETKTPRDLILKTKLSKTRPGFC
jgi:hypothetical protein